jgi:hypothetical protein
MTERQTKWLADHIVGDHFWAFGSCKVNILLRTQKFFTVFTKSPAGPYADAVHVLKSVSLIFILILFSRDDTVLTISASYQPEGSLILSEGLHDFPQFL